MSETPVVDEHSMRYTAVRDVLKRVRTTLVAVKGQPGENHDLKTVRGDLDYALKKLDDALDVKSARWKCGGCGHVVHLPKPAPRSVAGKCIRCGKTEFKVSA